MRTLCTSLGAWDTIEAEQRRQHEMTFPLAIVSATMTEAGYPPPECWEGERTPDTRARDVDALLVSMMDPRHMWRVAPWLRRVGSPVRTADRGEADPIVIVGGQAATAPEPIAHMADVVFVGEAEAGLPALLSALSGTGSRVARLDRAAALSGCYVPSRWPEGATVAKVEADDIAITLRHRISVSHGDNPRIELARGCRSRCGFCVLGWRASYRENDRADVLDYVDAMAASGRRQMHLSAGDAESYSGIEDVRRRLASHGVRDHSWTGRLDTLKDCSVTPGKLFAFGIEGMSHRLRRAVGKGRLTDDFVATEIGEYWAAGGRRLLLHMIGGLPGETDADEATFTELLRRLEGEARQHVPEGAIVELGRQPFGPLPHTPMQWFAPGLTSDRIGRAVAPWTFGGSMRIVDKAGQRYQDALLNAVVMRGGAEVQAVVEAGPPRLSPAPSVAYAEWCMWLMRAGLHPGRYTAAWDPDAPTPWDFVIMPPGHGRAEQRRAYDRIAASLCDRSSVTLPGS